MVINVYFELRRNDSPRCARLGYPVRKDFCSIPDIFVSDVKFRYGVLFPSCAPKRRHWRRKWRRGAVLIRKKWDLGGRVWGLHREKCRLPSLDPRRTGSGDKVHPRHDTREKNGDGRRWRTRGRAQALQIPQLSSPTLFCEHVVYHRDPPGTWRCVITRTKV